MNARIDEEKSLEVIRRVHQAIEDIKNGEMVVMVDDEDRENEGDLVYSANFSTPQKVNFMATHAKGLICVSVSNKIATRLELAPMVKNNDSSYETAFTISVDAKEATTGISANERDLTIKILASNTSTSDQLVKPGHIFPLIAKQGGCLVRTGHTEGSVDLCKLAKVGDCAVICEIMKEDGTMARRADLDIFCKEHDLNIVYISDLVEYRMMNESLIKVKELENVTFMERKAKKYVFLDHLENEHTAYIFGKENKSSTVKFHNIIPDIELLSSSEKFNDLVKSIEYLKKTNGILIFMNTKANNMSLIREYGVGAQILNYLGVKEISLLTKSGSKELVGISGFGLEVVEHINL